MAPQSIDDLDPTELADLDPTEIEQRLAGDGDDGKGNTVQPADPRGDPSNAEEERERGSTRPPREAEQGSSGQSAGQDTGDEGEGDTPAGKAGSEHSPGSEEGKPVETADGKHTIPYSVLKQEREQRKQLQQEMERLRQANPGDTSSTSEGGQGQDGGDQTAGTATDLNAYDWDKIAEEYGDEYARMMRERVDREAELERRLQQQEERERQREQAEQAQEAETVQGAIDNLPTLASWQSEDPAMFEAAKTMDNQLKEDPQWQGASYQQRFQEVVRRLRPNAPEITGHSSERDQGSGAPSDEGEVPPPTSHSDMPAGGTPPDARSEHERLEDADPMDIEARLERMTPERREQFLAGI